MAQLYKMELFVCDLNENLSLGEIKTLIEEEALDSCSINCICHFSNEKIGENIEWDDDIDINSIDCPTENWEKYFKENKNGNNRN